MLSLFKPAAAPATTARPATEQHPRTADRRTVSPRVDIRETASTVLIVADMPGVAADGVDVQVHGDVLTLRGRSRAQEPDGRTPIWREYAIRDYERSFRLGHAIDGDRITASARDGVIRVALPKRASAQPKRITVSGG